MNIYTIYRAINSINGKSYIGFTSNLERRKKEHKKFSNIEYNDECAFHRAIRKYGWDNFQWEIIYQSKNLYHTKNEMEPFFILEYKTFTELNESWGYNMTPGGEGVVQTSNIRKKIDKTCLEIYGYENPSSSPEIKEKKKQTYLKNFGVDHFSKTSQYNEIVKQSNLEKYGYESSNQSPIIKDKKKQTSLKNWGVENPNQSSIIKEKKKQNSIEKYGFDDPSKSPIVKENKKRLLKEKYGVENISQIPFFSIIDSRKTYPKGILSRYFPEFKIYY